MEQTQQQSQSTALATRQTTVGLIDPAMTQGWAEVFRKSGLFSFEGDPQTQLAQAQVKILAGTEMGLQPFFSMQNLYIVKAHVFVSAAAFGALVNGSQSTRFKTIQSNAEKAIIEFYRKVDGKWELAHTQTYTWDDVPAARRNNPTYTSDRADMIWNRAMTKGARKACPELVGGMRSYEEARDEADYQLVDDGNGHNGHGEPAGLLPPEAVEKSEPEAEQAGAHDEPAAIEPQAPAEQPAPKPAARKKAKAEPKPDETAVPTVDKPEPPVASADAETRVTPEQYAELIQWIVTEKLNGAAALRKAGLPQPDALDKATQAQYAAIKAEREVYIAQADEEFGWGHKPGETLTTEQIKQLQVRAEKAARK
jgi:hypothetical protein